MKHLITLLKLLFIAGLIQAQTNDWTTYYEQHEHNGTPRYAETMAYCQQLAEASPLISMDTFGISPQGRPLIVLTVDANGRHSVEEMQSSGNLILLVQSGIHAGEPDGKDAMLTFLRDMVTTGQGSELLDGVSILWIPILNVDGHERYGRYSRINQNGPEEMGWRTNAQNLNLNRDYLKDETPEISAWLRLFNAYLPDFFIDCHTTDGADYQYPATYALEVFGNMDEGLTRWQTDTYLPALNTMMENLNMPLFPYVSFRRWHDPRSGLYAAGSTPRLSQGYTALQNRPGLLIETHMLKPYRVRVEVTRAMIETTLGILNDQHRQLASLIADADSICSSEAFREKPFPLRFQTDFTDSTMVRFRGISYDCVTSDLTGGDWFVYGKDTMTFILPYFNHVNAAEYVDLPVAYIVPPQWEFLIPKLEDHGVEYYRTAQSASLDVDTYQLQDCQWQSSPYEGRHPLWQFNLTTVQRQVDYPAGSLVIPVKQRRARIVVNMFEPKAPDSWLYWGFFDAVTEQKEYAESYSMEHIAREMIRENPHLTKELEQWKLDHPEQATVPYAILQWFYQQSPWWDDHKDVYPVARIMSTDQLPVEE